MISGTIESTGKHEAKGPLKIGDDTFKGHLHHIAGFMLVHTVHDIGFQASANELDEAMKHDAATAQSVNDDNEGKMVYD